MLHIEILQYQDNPSLENYTEFTASIEKITLRISMITMSHSFLKQLWQGEESSEPFNF